MPEQLRKLDRFTAAILSEAAEEAEQTLETVKKKHDAAYSDAEKKIALEAYHYVHDEASRIRVESGRRVSRHMLDNKKTLYLRRGEIAAEVFEGVRARIEKFTQTPAYFNRLEELCRESMDILGGADDAKVLLRGEDADFARELAENFPAVRFGEGEFSLGGLMAASESLGLFIDSTYDTAMEELSGHFAELFGLSLSDKLGDALPGEGTQSK